MQPLSQHQDVLTRESLIAVLRQELSKRAGDLSLCSLAAEKGIFCGGFRRFTDDELRQKFNWIARKRPGANRSEIEAVADAWQLARQDVRGLLTACDVQREEHDLCNGWDDFSDDDLVVFYRELAGQTVTVIPGDVRHVRAGS